MTGFSQAVRVASTLNAFYPIGNVDCCTPSVLLSSGEQAHVVATPQHAGYRQRCNCCSPLSLWPQVAPCHIIGSHIRCEVFPDAKWQRVCRACYSHSTRCQLLA